MELPTRFNLRVYGLLQNSSGDLLLAHESIRDFHFTKFPGGGLEFGEGPEDCLIREFREETGLEVTIAAHFYTTGFYQPSAFNPSDQLVSIYYRVLCPDLSGLPKELTKVGPDHHIRFDWVKRSDLKDSLLTFPIDKHVAALIKEKDF